MRYIPFLFSILFLSTIIQAQNVGIGTTTPLALLHVKDSSVLFTGGGIPLDPPGYNPHPPLSGMGHRMMWFPAKTAFRVGYVGGTNWDRDNIGLFSFAAGENPLASGLSSIALGRNAQATANYAVAIGDNVKATGDNTTAFGLGSTASGKGATVTGEGNQAEGFSSFVAGMYNEYGASETNVSATTPLFTIGNGDNTNSRQNIMVIRKGGSIEFGKNINTIARLSMGYNSSAAGDYSVAMGQACTASGFSSIALGNLSSASGYSSFAAGQSAEASGFRSIAIGEGSLATSDYSIALGGIARGNSSVALGPFTSANGKYSSSTGFLNHSNGYSSFVAGMYNDSILTRQTIVSSLTPLFIIGNGNASNDRSNALVVLKNGNMAIGDNGNPVNKLQITGTINNVSLLDNSGMMTLGYTSSTNMVVDQNDIQVRLSGAESDLYLQRLGGNIGIGSTGVPAYQLEITGTAGKPGGGSWSNASDRRLKENIQPYADGLQQVLQIKPVRYHYNAASGYDTKPEYIGIIAQELQTVAPYMVGTLKKEDKEYLSVDNSAMTYMLINAVKEQQLQIELLKKEIEILKNK
ncbi:MAG: tail fiber domain-containing protein [Chitinophagaceae bacterium]